MTEEVGVAVYGRISDDNRQRETSIEDQLRRCKALAKQHGLPADNVMIFKDVGISGNAAGEQRREGFKQLLEAWEANAFHVLLVDEFSRLSRDVLTQAELIRRLEQNQRVRMLTANGVDTARPNWQLQLGLESIVSQQSGRDTRHRVVRGMVGQLERGYMIATPAYGYRLKREFDGKGNRTGSRWLVEKSEAAIVKKIFERRTNGESMHAIARWLNESGVPTRRSQRTTGGGFWRPASVRNLLSNPIYRGVFVWHGSATHRKRAAKQGREVEPQSFDRPELRLVSDESWWRCNTKSVHRSGYGGGKHALAGLVNCGFCGSTLVLSSHERCKSLYCASCTVAKSVVLEQSRLTSTVAAEGVRTLLVEAVRHFLTTTFVREFQSFLRERMEGGVEQSLEKAKADLAAMFQRQERLSRILAGSEREDPLLETRYAELRQRAHMQQRHVEELEAGAKSEDRSSLQAQISAVDVSQVAESLFDSRLSPQRVRAILGRLFSEIIFEGKEGRYRSFFKIRFSMGAALALVTETDTVDEGECLMCFELRFKPDNRGKRSGGSNWSVRCLSHHELAAANSRC